MSLINEMLRNLEAKRPDDLVKQNLQREIRALPAGTSRQGRWLKGILAGALLSAGVVICLQTTGAISLPHDLFAEAPSVVVVPAPLLPPPLSAPAAQLAAVDASETPLFSGLRVDRSLEFIPVSAANSLAIADSLPAAKLPPLLPSASTSAPDKVEKPASDPVKSVPVDPALSGSVKISKSPVLATPRDRAEAEYRRAEMAASAGHGADASAILRGALKIDPGHIQARQALMRLLLEQRKPEEAIAVLNEGLVLLPGQIGWAMSLARLQLEQGDLAAADRSLLRSQTYAEASAEHAGFQGHLKSRLGENHQAASYYLKASRLAPGEGRWWLGLGLALEAEGKPGESKEAFRRSLATANLPAELSAIAQQHLR